MPLRLAGRADLDRVDAERVEHLTMLAERSLQREDARLHATGAPGGREFTGYQPRPASFTSSVSIALALHRGAETTRHLRDDLGVGVVRGRLDDRLGPGRPGSSLLKMPEPTNTACAPSCITSDASAGVAMPPAQNNGTGSSPRSATSWTRSAGAMQLLGPAVELLVLGHRQLLDVAEDRAEVTDGLDDVAGAGLALGPDHAGALGDAPQRLAEVGRAAHERRR